MDTLRDQVAEVQEAEVKMSTLEMPMALVSRNSPFPIFRSQLL